MKRFLVSFLVIFLILQIPFSRNGMDVANSIVEYGSYWAYPLLVNRCALAVVFTLIYCALDDWRNKSDW